MIVRFARDLDPDLDRLTARLEELHDVRLVGFLLADRQLLDDRAGVVAHIDDAQLENVGSAQHRIDAGVEEREVAQRGMGLPAQLVGASLPDMASWATLLERVSNSLARAKRITVAWSGVKGVIWPTALPLFQGPFSIPAFVRFLIKARIHHAGTNVKPCFCSHFYSGFYQKRE